LLHASSTDLVARFVAGRRSTFSGDDHGHEGSLIAIHANTPPTLSNFWRFSAHRRVDLPRLAIREADLVGLDLIIHLTRRVDAHDG